MPRLGSYYVSVLGYLLRIPGEVSIANETGPLKTRFDGQETNQTPR
jgi:hypothetical protein